MDCANWTRNNANDKAMSITADHDADGATTMNLSETPQDVVPIDEIKRRLDIHRTESITRFRDVSLIGIGGVSEVFSAREPVLNRDVALKVLRPASRNQLHLVEGFVREARATAQIDHPNIIPVHEMGVFDDAGVYFTMKKVEGETLRGVLEKLRAGDPDYIRKYTLRRLLEIFSAAGQGVAFAHSRGILHCDLKPGNLMLGEYGEVLVMDWGLVRHNAAHDTSREESRIDLNGSMPEDGLGRHGERPESVLSGTPAFMAPELISGGEPGTATDLYALGAILYCILTLRNSPFDEGLPIQCVLGLGVRGSFLNPRKRAKRLNIPRELEAICMKAMAHDPARRYPAVTELLKDIRNYLDNYPVEAYRPTPFYRFFKLCKRRPFIPVSTLVALITAIAIFGALDLEREAKVRSAMELAQTNILQGDVYYYQASAALRNWQRALAIGDTAHLPELERELTRQQSEFENYYENAVEILSQVDNSRSRQEELAEQVGKIFERRLEFSLQSGRYEDSRRLLDKLSQPRYQVLAALLESNPRLKEHLELIRTNHAVLRLSTVPYGASVSYLSFDANGTPREHRSDETTPLAMQLAAGEYVLIVKAQMRPPVYYPLILSVAETLNVNLFLPKDFPEGTIYIPAGKVEVPTPRQSIKSQLNIPGFFIKATEVSFGEYLEFWKSLSSSITKERYMAYWQSSPGIMIPCWDADGILAAPFDLSEPAVGITGEAAQAYCRYLSARLEQSCRLPTEYEWQKAAFGVDNRNYVWGKSYIPGAALLADSVPLRLHADRPGRFPMDTSLYGVSDMAGNVREFVRSNNDSGSVFVTKGGSFMTGPVFCQRDFTSSSAGVANDVGFRYVIELPSPAEQESK